VSRKRGFFFGIKGESGSSRGRRGRVSLSRGGSRKRDHLPSISRLSLSRDRFCLIDRGGTLFSRPPREILFSPFSPLSSFLLPTFIRAPCHPALFFLMLPRESCLSFCLFPRTVRFSFANQPCHARIRWVADCADRFRRLRHRATRLALIQTNDHYTRNIDRPATCSTHAYPFIRKRRVIKAHVTHR